MDAARATSKKAGEVSKETTPQTRPSSDELAELMGRVAGGDEAAFAGVYDALSPGVYGLALRVLRNPAQAQEVTQEVFLAVWREAPRFDQARSTVRTWVGVIAHRRAVDRVRAEESRNRREERLPPVADAENEDPVSESVSDSIDRRSDRDRVRKALATLTERQREAVELAYFEGFTYRRVAQVLGVPEGTAKTRIRDGMIRLRDALGGDR
jgi:RNA polymerase sigma-70 factor (ECF subfamily)